MGARRDRILMLWNQVGEDEYVALAEAGPQELSFKPGEMASEVGTLQDELDALTEAVSANGYNVKSVNIDDDVDTLIDTLRSWKPDAVFNLVEFFNDRADQEAYVAGLFEMMKIPYTGNTPRTLIDCQRKYRTKLLLESQGVSTPVSRRYHQVPVPRDHGLPYPLIVKPAREDASGGINATSVVHDYDALNAQVQEVIEFHQQPALVERYIDGREVHVAILGNDPPVVLPLLEYEFEEPQEEGRPKILTYEAKWDPLSPDFYALDVSVPPRDLPRHIAKRIREHAVAAYTVTGCRDYARVDLRLDADGTPYVLEVNPNPDLAEGVGYMLCAEKSGRTFVSTIGEIIEMALARGEHRTPTQRARSTQRGTDARAKAKSTVRTAKGGAKKAGKRR